MNNEIIYSELPTLLLHIGGAKCGSSSLQTFLTNNPRIDTLDSKTLEYWVIRPDLKHEGKFDFTHPTGSKIQTLLPYVSSDLLNDSFGTL